MRLAFIAAEIRKRSYLVGGPIDAEWLRQLAEAHDVTVLVDHETLASPELRDAGIPVYSSPKRPMPFPGKGMLPADHVQAHLLAQHHADRPFDLLVYSSDRTVDLAWYEPSLSDVPRAVALGDGPLRDLRLVLDDADLYEAHGRSLWAATGFAVSADLLIGDVPPTAFGMVGDGLPERFSASPLPPVGDHLPEGVSMVTVVATTEDKRGLLRLLGRVTAILPGDTSPIIVVICRDVTVGRESTRELALAGCPAEFLTSTIVIPVLDEARAGASFLARSDAIVAARPTDLAIRAVADAAHDRPAVLLEGTIEDAPLLTSVSRFPRRDRPRVLALPIEGPPAAAAAALDGDEHDVALVVAPGQEALTERLSSVRGLDALDLIAVGRPGPVFGEPRPDELAAGVLGVGRGAWPAMRRWMAEGRSLRDLVRWSLDPSLAEHARLAILPGAEGEAYETLPRARGTPAPTWIGSNGLLPRPNLLAVGNPSPPSLRKLAFDRVRRSRFGRPARRVLSLEARKRIARLVLRQRS